MINRRDFVKSATVFATAGVSKAAAPGVSIIADPIDPVAASPAVQWALRELAESLKTQGVTVTRCETFAQARSSDVCILAAGFASPVASQVANQSNIALPATAESLALLTGNAAKRKVLLASGHDPRGLVYALLELTDRVQNYPTALAAISLDKPIVESPANPVRSVTRLFTSDIEDKPWYNDREMWPRYLSMLANQRFNRFNLAFGIGYDFIRQVTDAYFLFAYPFLLPVPGYSVSATPLPEAERDNNLAMLRFISEQTVARGMEFQLGLWMHGYQWIDSPNPNYTIEGITKENHGPYCRDAVRLVLQQCPAISGITFRVHGESGVEEGSYDFWKTVFDGVATCGRKVRIDMHAKGMDQSMLDMAVATKQPVTLSPKFWAEHMGMTYHQADIRELEQPKAGKVTTGLMKLSAGSRSFLRYGYGDLLREDRPWDVVHRIWPGTQRLLLWADPASAAAYSRAFQFCGSAGVEICEPLSFKGRRGSGLAGDRAGYADQTLRPRWDWEKYVYGHRVWGRLLYNPDAEPECWRRYLNHEFSGGGEHVEAALANASRILPVVTTSHGASAGNNTYWPEVYLNQSLWDAEHFQPYTDTPAPRTFGNVSPLDPQLFSRINDFADELLTTERTGKYSPIEAAQLIDDFAAEAAKHLAQADAKTKDTKTPVYRRMAVDVAIQSGLGRFFGAKFRAGVLYRLYEKTGDREALYESVNQYAKARAAWNELANRAKGVYVSDITVGEHPQLRGHWLDRLPAIDRDIAVLQEKLAGLPQAEPQPKVALAIKEVLGRPVRNSLPATHTPPPNFHPSRDLQLMLTLERPAELAKLYYRHVTQAERYNSVQMEARNHVYTATIPSSYTDSKYPLEYYFEVKEAPAKVFLYPGFSAGASPTRQPYFVVRQAKQA